MTRSPDLILAVAGQPTWAAWQVTLPEPPPVPAQAAALACWFLHCPGAHAFWSCWVASVIHLRDLPGVGPAKIVVPGATHEFLVAALDPMRDPEPDNLLSWSLLHPLDLVHQVCLPCDADAQEVLRLYVQHVMSGTLSPDSDFRRHWERILDATAAHYRAGKHGAT